ncbi:hypothetical protein GCM10009596_01560 [Arthrobacter rhombi]
MLVSTAPGVVAVHGGGFPTVIGHGTTATVDRLTDPATAGILAVHVTPINTTLGTVIGTAAVGYPAVPAGLPGVRASTARSFLVMSVGRHRGGTSTCSSSGAAARIPGIGHGLATTGIPTVHTPLVITTIGNTTTNVPVICTAAVGYPVVPAGLPGVGTPTARSILVVSVG